MVDEVRAAFKHKVHPLAYGSHAGCYCFAREIVRQTIRVYRLAKTTIDVMTPYDMVYDEDDVDDETAAEFEYNFERRSAYMECVKQEVEEYEDFIKRNDMHSIFPRELYREIKKFIC
jgi:hypothetical protein